MATPSGILIRVNGVDVTSDVIYQTARFECQRNAVPGVFEFTVKDLAHAYTFITGQEVQLEIDGSPYYGGFVLQIGRSYPMAAMDTVNVDPTEVPRYWVLRGVDYNILFDKRVLRNPADYLHQIPHFIGTTMDGDLIQQLCDDYLDFTDVDSTTFVDNIQPPFNFTPDASRRGAWMQQGTTARKQIEDWTQFTGALYYIDPAKNLHHHALEDAVMRWGFSDNPNRGGVVTASPATYQGITVGPREFEAIESGEHMVNDAFVWGGSQWAGSGGTVFSRETNATSITDHGRWQIAETHFGEDGYKLQEGVDVRADLIVNGSPGAVAADQNRGLRYPQWSFKFAWFGHHVPTLSGVPDHVLPGYLSTITMETFETSGDPLVQLLPLRTVTVTFPAKPEVENESYVRFEGFFGLQPDDPFSLWRFLLKNRAKIINPALTVVDDDSPGTIYGAIGHFTFTGDGSTTVFITPFGYVIGSTRVYVNGVLLLPGTDYTESDPITGELTFTSAPAGAAVIQVTCRTLSA